MALPQVLYRTALRALRVLAPMMHGDSKLARGMRGRRHAHEKLVAWGRQAHTDSPRGPIVWVHASSVGESIQARAVIDALRGRMPRLRVVFTFFSPSAEGVRGDFPADVCTYLPWDLPGVMGAVLDAVRPSLIVFTQREVWPTLVQEAAARGVPAVLVAGTMPEGAGRLSMPGRILLGPAFGSLRSVAAVSEEDGARFGRLGVESDRVTVTGDPGVDAAGERAAAIGPDSSHMRVFERIFGGDVADSRVPILVAGSTWPSDEEVLLPALARVRESVPGLRIVLVPHEPDGCDFLELGRKLERDGWASARLSVLERELDAVERGHEAVEQGPEAAEQGPNAILVDRVGVLADLYSLAAVAYVGGGFHVDGLHSVLEPAAVGVPVLIGPRHQGSVHAVGLLATGAARCVADAGVLASTLREWLEAPKKKEEHGRRASDYIVKHRGSAERTADLITRFFPGRN